MDSISIFPDYSEQSTECMEVSPRDQNLDAKKDNFDHITNEMALSMIDDLLRATPEDVVNMICSENSGYTTAVPLENIQPTVSWAEIGKQEPKQELLETKPEIKGSEGKAGSEQGEKVVTGRTYEGGPWNQKYTTLMQYFRPPQVMARLTIALTLLTRPGILTSMVDAPIDLENIWAGELGIIRKKLNAGMGHKSDWENYAHYNGYYFQKVQWDFTRKLFGRVYEADYYVPEIGRSVPTPETEKLYCQFCEVPHVLKPFQCKSTRKHGPKDPDFIGLDPEWARGVQAIVVGASELRYLPVSLKKRVLNFSASHYPGYSVPTNAKDTDRLRTEHGSLYAHLKNIVEKVGLQAVLPIFVEFYPDRSSANSVMWHCLGFITTIRAVQRLYNGPIVVLVASMSPTPGMTLTQFNYLGQTLDVLQRWLSLMGLAMGVPVGVMPLQSLDHPTSRTYQRFDFWEEEPLFAHNGKKTREFYARVQYYLNKSIEAFESAEKRNKFLKV